MLAKDINVKINDVPEGWSIEAADFINKVMSMNSIFLKLKKLFML